MVKCNIIIGDYLWKICGGGKYEYNERSWAIDVILEINQWASTKDLLIKRAGGENTIWGNVLFPDVLLYEDYSAGVILQGWELKMPDTPINLIDVCNLRIGKAFNNNSSDFKKTLFEE